MFSLSVGSICRFARQNPRSVVTVERMIASVNAEGALIQPIVGPRLWPVPYNQRRDAHGMSPAYIRDFSD